jgi:hypothetical protein
MSSKGMGGVMKKNLTTKRKSDYNYREIDILGG